MPGGIFIFFFVRIKLIILNNLNSFCYVHFNLITFHSKSASWLHTNWSSKLCHVCHFLNHLMFFFNILQTNVCETRVVLYCYQAFNVYYYKYTVQGINIFALSILFNTSWMCEPFTIKQHFRTCKNLHVFGFTCFFSSLISSCRPVTSGIYEFNNWLHWPRA